MYIVIPVTILCAAFHHSEEVSFCIKLFGIVDDEGAVPLFQFLGQVEAAHRIILYFFVPFIGGHWRIPRVLTIPVAIQFGSIVVF